MLKLHGLLENNQRWVSNVTAEDPDFFKNLSVQQSPEILWVGCSDSRVPANQIIDLLPGELFVHRNVANLVVHTDLNCLSVLQFAVDVLKVKHIIVCGHYRCGGVVSALRGDRLGLIDNWLRHIVDVKEKYRARLDACDTLDDQANLLCELNVMQQVINTRETTIVQDAWSRGQNLTVHGWIYDVRDGLIQDLNISVDSPR